MCDKNHHRFYIHNVDLPAPEYPIISDFDCNIVYTIARRTFSRLSILCDFFFFFRYGYRSLPCVAIKTKRTNKQNKLILVRISPDQMLYEYWEILSDFVQIFCMYILYILLINIFLFFFKCVNLCTINILIWSVF